MDKKKRKNLTRLFQVVETNRLNNGNGKRREEDDGKMHVLERVQPFWDDEKIVGIMNIT